jgi:hypothetical protein
VGSKDLTATCQADVQPRTPMGQELCQLGRHANSWCQHATHNPSCHAAVRAINLKAFVLQTT